MRKKGKKVIRPAGDELMDYLNRGFAICNRCGAVMDPLYLHPRFRAFFDRRAGTGTDGLYPTVTIRQIMWALKMKPLPKQPWETVFDHTPI